MPKLQTYTESKTIKFSKQQIEAFEELKKYNINVPNFVRAAIKEKLKRDWKQIKIDKLEKEKFKCPF